YMNDEAKFEDPKNEKLISEKLKENSNLIKQVKHAKQLDTSTLKISSQVLEDHFKEIERIFRVGNKSFARWQLSSTLPICMSCHTQTPSDSKRWDLAELTQGKLNAFEKAELLFMGRDYEDALKLYNDVIQNYPNNKIKVT